MIPRHLRQVTSPAPDQLFSAGYRDGLNRRVPHPQFQTNPHYLKGYVEGCRSTPPCPSLIAFTRSPSLDSAFLSIVSWERDQERFGFGSVALSYGDGLWIVLVSKDLHDAALPF
ncbi:hypothetical protein H6F51_10450 [Cyanobacteria bacterium FACHB-DQ100]|nr:hypothetical protein [Cyanobacteria bacterium FACHB-DQ100]